jgi:two-component system OmpR family response regulator
MPASALHKILYVEDEADLQAVAQLVLQAVGGFTVKICSSGQEALEQAESFAPDLILLDAMLPDMDGPATLSALRQRPACAHIPVCFVTAKTAPQEIAQYKALGALEVIPKPFDPMALSAQVTAIWDRQHGG